MDFAVKLKRYYIHGKVSHRERVQILERFQESHEVNTIFLSEVGDTAINLPSASVVRRAVDFTQRGGDRRVVGDVGYPKSGRSALGLYRCRFLR